MQFIISSSDLLKGLMDVSKAIPAKSAIPILENFLLELNGGELTITASDSEITLRTTIEVLSTEEEGSMTVPARHMTDLLKSLPDQPVTISSSEASFECAWSSGNSTLPYFPAEDYPEIGGASEEAKSVSFIAASLLDGINHTIYATSDDEMRPAMNGIFFDIGTASTTLVASDSHKLICWTTDDAESAITDSFILHKKSANILKSIIDKDSDERITVIFDTNTVVFTLGPTTMICRLVIGKFPKYRDVIPINNSNVLKIERNTFLSTIRRVSVCANRSSNYIKLKLSQGQVEITAEDLGFSTSAYEKLSCDYVGDDLVIGFKSTFLAEILSNMSCETVVMKFLDQRKAALIIPDEEEADKDKICGILMPIMV